MGRGFSIEGLLQLEGARWRNRGVQMEHHFLPNGLGDWDSGFPVRKTRRQWFGGLGKIDANGLGFRDANGLVG